MNSISRAVNAAGAGIAWLFVRLLLDPWRQIDREYADIAEAEAKARARRAASVQSPLDESHPETAASRTRKGKKKKRTVRKPEKPATSKAATSSKAGAATSGTRSTWYDWRVIVVLIVVAVSLSMQEYYGERGYFRKLFPYDPRHPSEYYELLGYAWWSGWRFLGYVVIPVLAIACMPGERLRDYYITLRGFFRHLPLYAILFALIFPAVVIASQTEAFYKTYPFYKWSNRSLFDLLVWEALYALQFLSLEFFFRGFMLRGLGPAMGSKAIFVMIVPYCMIHFGKPFPETIGAIFAGIILGTVAMRTRSIWGGVLIHLGVAFTMDFLALGHCPPAESGLPCKGH